MKRTLFGMVLLGVLISSSAHAIVITAPTGLNPGDQYRLAFVTSTGIEATSTNIANYNAFVTGVANSVAELAALGTTWTAIGSTITVDARDNTSTNPAATGVPIYLLNNTKLADNNADLWDGSIDNQLRITESGGDLTALVWTGTYAGGTKALGATLGSGVVQQGLSFNFLSAWVELSTAAPFTQQSVYAMSGVLTVSAVPVPAAVWLFGSALGLMGVMRRKIIG